MNSKSRPAIKCMRVDAVNINDWNKIESIFKPAEFADFQQGWRDTPSPGFRPAKAAAVWTADALFVYGELCDDDIFNTVPEEDFNKLAIAYGDMFEIFLQPAGQDSYFEFHVSPNNQQFQLRLPCRNAFTVLKDKFESSEAMLESFKIRDPRITSNVCINQAARKWRVIVRLPLAMLVESEPVVPGSKWLFSFSRYDYTRPETKPEFSSTSPHSAINYHLVDEYGTMEFC